MIEDGNGSYMANLTVNINSSGDGDKDHMIITARNIDTGDSRSVDVVVDKTDYEISIPSKINDKIEVSVSGTQYLNEGVYFFEPEAKDKDDDGIATVREASQNLVGISAGTIPVGDSVILDTTEIEIQKINTDDEPLAGAAFTLSYAGEHGFEIGTYTVDQNGKLKIDGLMAGVTYELKETKTPDGYHSISQPILITISGDGTSTRRDYSSIEEKR